MLASAVWTPCPVRCLADWSWEGSTPCLDYGLGLDPFNLWEPPTLIQAPANYSLGAILC
jgi:hypothetical protein